MHSSVVIPFAADLVGLGLIGLTGLAALAVLGHFEQQRRHGVLDGIAQSWGIERSGDSLHGQIDAVPVVVREALEGGKNKRHYTYITWQLPAAWRGLLQVREEGFLDAMSDFFGSSDLQVRQSVIDERLRIDGCARTATAMFADPRVRQAWLQLTDQGTLVLKDASFELKQRGRISEERRRVVFLGAKLARRLEDLRRAPWAEAASRLSLTLDPTATHLRGEVHGEDIEVRLTPGKPGRTVISSRLHRELPDGTRISRQGSGGVELGDPILDGALHIEGHPPTLKELLCNDETRALLMTVVHGYPASIVSHQAVVLRAKGQLLVDLEQAIRDVAALSQRLSGRARG